MQFVHGNRRGQILVMVTLALFAMCGMLGLAVDLGWSYFVKKSAQAAADAAALAAVSQAFDNVGLGPYSQDTDKTNMVWWSTPQPCPDTNTGTTNIDKGCLYAEVNGFKVSDSQNVLMQSGFGPPIPTAPGVNEPQYWVTARVSETIPQLFSSISGNTAGIASARATAAIVKSDIIGSLILLNRQNDCVPMEGGSGKPACGVNLMVQANDNQGKYALQADGGILMASTNDGSNNSDNRFAGENQGGGTVDAPFTWIREDGWYHNQGSSSWQVTPANQKPDRSDWFRDPFRKAYGQPPPPPDDGSIPEKPVIGGSIIGSDDPANPLSLEPGYYYAAGLKPDGSCCVATGEQIHITGSVDFTRGNRTFGEYVFFGGITVGQQGKGVTQLQFDQGRYVFAGVKEQPGGKPGVLFDITTNLSMTDNQPAFQEAPASHGGEIFIFTGFENGQAYYGRDPIGKNGADVSLHVPVPVQDRIGELKFGISGFQAGNNVLNVNLHGLNRKSDVVPENLKAFDAPLLLWQDQRNSVIDYYKDGSFNMGCVEGNNVGGECNKTLSNNKSPELFFKASPGSSLWGVIYQPRGAWTTVWGGSGYAGPLQIITGAFQLQATANLWLQGVDQPILTTKITLVE
jgi:hypothetical protein